MSVRETRGREVCSLPQLVSQLPARRALPRAVERLRDEHSPARRELGGVNTIQNLLFGDVFACDVLGGGAGGGGAGGGGGFIF